MNEQWQGGETKILRGTKPPATEHPMELADYPTNSYYKGTAGAYNGSRQKLANCRYIGRE